MTDHWTPENATEEPIDSGGVAREALRGVKVTKDGGSVGPPCTFTYTVDDLDGNELATDITPQTTRMAAVTYALPAADSAGLAYWDGNTLKLYSVAEEVPIITAVEVQTTYSVDTANKQLKKTVRTIQSLGASSTTQSVVHTGTACIT